MIGVPIAIDGNDEIRHGFAPTLVTVTDAKPFLPSLDAVMVTGPPTDTPVIRPEFETLATAGFPDSHVTTRPDSVLLFASRGVAVSCSDDPTASADAAGATTTDATGTNTLTEAVPLLPSLLAVIVTADPTATPVTTPLAETVATAGLLDDQLVLRPLIGLPLASRGVAVNCADAPGATLSVGGVTVTLAMAASTLIDAVPDFPPLDAVIVIGPPAAMVATSPPDVTAATAGLEELQVIVRPLSAFPLLSRSVAANCWVSPAMSEAFDGDTAIDAIGACSGPELSPPLQAVNKPSHATTGIDRNSLRVISPTLAKHL